MCVCGAFYTSRNINSSAGSAEAPPLGLPSRDIPRATQSGSGTLLSMADSATPNKLTYHVALTSDESMVQQYKLS